MRRLLILVICLGLCGCASDQTRGLRIYAAASTADLAQAVADSYRRQTGHQVSVNVAATSILARQMQQGAPGGLFIAAHPRWVDVLAKDGLVSRRQPWLRNRMVLVANGPGPSTNGAWPTLQALQAGRLAIGDPSHVPAGAYAEQVLRKRGIWESIQPALMPAGNVRAALQWVLLGEAGYGLVYATDALAEDRCHLVFEVPESWHEPIIYEVAMVGDMTSLKADAFDFWTSAAAASIGQSLGFSVMESSVTER